MKKFSFRTLNEEVKVSSMTRDFNNEVLCGIHRLVKNGVIQPYRCFANAVFVARLLEEKGIKGITIIDGLYSPKYRTGGTDTHRFIKHTAANGQVRYYDPSLEFLRNVPKPEMMDYYAIREFDLPEMERYALACSADFEDFSKGTDMVFGEEFLFTSSLDGYFRFPNSLYIRPFITKDGDFGTFQECIERVGYSKEDFVKNWREFKIAA